MDRTKGACRLFYPGVTEPDHILPQFWHKIRCLRDGFSIKDDDWVVDVKTNQIRYFEKSWI